MTADPSRELSKALARRLLDITALNPDLTVQQVVEALGYLERDLVKVWIQRLTIGSSR